MQPQRLTGAGILVAFRSPAQTLPTGGAYVAGSGSIASSGQAVVLAISGKRDEPTREASSRLTLTALSLVYAPNPAHPDVFELKKDSF